MANLPTPLRAALGLAATAIDEARKLPEALPQLPVAVIGTAMQASLRVQQHIAEYAARGDELISQLRGGSDEPPSWATFDDEAGSSNGAGSASGPAKAAFELIEEDDADARSDTGSDADAGSEAGAQAAAEATSAPAPDPVPAPAKKAAASKATKATKAVKAAAAESAAKKSPAKKAARKAIHSEPLAQAAQRAEPTDRPNPSVLAAEIAQAHPGETRPGAAQ